MDEPEAIQKRVSFSHDQDVIAAREESHTLPRARVRGVAEKGNRNLEWRRGRRDLRSYNSGGLGNLRDRRRRSHEDIPMRAGILEFLNLLEEIEVELGSLYVKRLKLGVGIEDAGKAGDLASCGEIKQGGEKDQESSEKIEFHAPPHRSGPEIRV
jgi:hypothetical protein